MNGQGHVLVAAQVFGTEESPSRQRERLGAANRMWVRHRDLYLDDVSLKIKRNHAQAGSAGLFTGGDECRAQLRPKAGHGFVDVVRWNCTGHCHDLLRLFISLSDLRRRQTIGDDPVKQV